MTTAFLPPSDRSASAAAKRSRLSEIWPLLKDTVKDWSDDGASRLAAALSCYTLLSLAPLVILTVSVTGLVFGDDAARGQVSQELGGLVGPRAGEAVQTVIANAEAPSAGIVSTILGVAVLLFGAPGVFVELQDAMNTIWEVKPKPNEGVRGFLRHRFFSFAMVLAVAFLMLVSLLVSAGLAAAGKFFAGYLPGGETLWQVVNFAVAFAITTLLFALIFKVVPDVEVRWREVWVGGALTALLFTIGKFGLGLYIGKSSVTSSFGVAGSLVALVIWVYYSSQILFLGAEFTQVYARRFGGRIRPSPHAVPATQA